MVSACLYGACGLWVSAAGLRPDQQIIAGVVKRAQLQDCHLQEYSVIRRYTLRNRHLDGDASLTVRLEYQAGRGKQFSVLECAGPGVAQHALMSLLREEKSNDGNSSWNAVTPANYWFTLLGQETHDGRRCYHFEITPRENNKLLIDGELWVDVQDLAVVAIKGRPARSVSFWLGRPLIEQHFAPVDGFWMPSGNETNAQVRLAGDTELSIEYKDYKFRLPSLSLKTP